MILPGAPVSKIDPRLVSRDPAVVADYAGDPLNHHGPIVAAVAREFVLATSTLPAEVQQITLPTLLMWGTDDRLCPPSGAEMVAANIGSDDLTVERFPGLFHEIMNEPEQAKVLDAIVVWLDAHVPQAAATGAGSPGT
jgi:alpha-beta hydrolase superfamily lysophospholipase